MEVSKYNFREIDRSFFMLEDKENIKLLNKKCKTKIKNDNPLMLYGYIDLEYGIQFRICGNIICENDVLFLEDRFIKKMYFIEYDFVEKMNFELIDERVYCKINGSKEIHLSVDKFYKDNDLIETRNNKQLDSCRDPRLVDDIQFLIINNKAKQEGVWGRIISEDNGMVKCVILDKVLKIFNLKKGDIVWLKYVERPNFKGLVFVRKERRNKA